MLKALIVDDEKMPRDILVNYIDWNSLGFNIVKQAEDGIDAMKIVHKIMPDVIISDIKMPKMDGIELATQVRTYLPNCKFIFLSGYSDKEYLKSAIKLKAVSYVEKPINLEEITDILSSISKECINEKHKKEENLLLIEQKLCLDLINKNIDFDDAENKLEYIGEKISSDCEYITAIIKFNDQNIIDMREEIVTLLKSSLKEISSEYIMGYKEDCIIIHFIFSSSDFIDSIIETLEVFITDINNSIDYRCKLFIGIGQVVYSLSNIYISYNMAVLATQKLFFKGYNKCILYNKYKTDTFEFDENILTLLNEHLRAEEQIQSEMLIKRLFNDIRKNESTNIDYVKNIFYKIILVISVFAKDRNISLFEYDDKYILESVSKANTLDDIEEYVLNLIESIFSTLEKTNNNSDILSKITSYINENFSDENFSINSISQVLNLTPAYLCMVFKRDTYKTINQYITSLRIEKSKEYLITDDIKLYDVAKRVGYKDGKYFTKVFTKHVGISPKKYREIHYYDCDKKDI